MRNMVNWQLTSMYVVAGGTHAECTHRVLAVLSWHCADFGVSQVLKAVLKSTCTAFKRLLALDAG
jgi:hypothetical protein